MAGDWIKMRNDLRSDPAVFKLASLTGLDRFAVVGRLAEFWGWADKHSVDGFVDGGTSQAIDDVVVYEGFAEALTQVHWLVITESGIEIPKHELHNGDSAKERSLKNERQARWRAKKAIETASKSVDVSASTQASTREEKRREEKNTDTSAAKLPPCPHQELISLFGKHLPMLSQPKPELWKGKKADAMKARWVWVLTTKSSKTGQLYATDHASALSFFERYFDYVAKSDFLTGRNGAWTGCSLEWLMNEANFAKALEGQYENKEQLA